MIELSRAVGLMPPTKISVAAVPIQPLDLRVPLPDAAPPKGVGCPRPYCNTSLNSRLPAAAPAAVKLRWMVPFVEAFEATTVLQDGDRVIAYGGGSYRLYDLDGRPVSDGRHGASGIVLDARNGLFYFISTSGFLTARRLSDGGEEFNLNVSPADSWSFLARHEQRMFALGADRPQAWRPEPPRHAVLEHLDLPAQIRLDDARVVNNLTAAASLEIESSTVSMAMREGDVVFAVPGRIYLSPGDLQPHGALESDFVARALSVDELGRIHLLVGSGNSWSLWVLTPAGQRTAEHKLAVEHGAPLSPPVIGYDHRIFLVTSGLAAFDANGALLWEKWPRGRVAGAGVTTDGQLLVVDGDLAAYDPKGERRVLFTMPGVSLVSPPAMSAAGEIFAASRDKVFCLKPHQ